METTNAHRNRSRRTRPHAARLLFFDPAGSLRVELLESGRRSRVRAEFRDRGPAERFLEALSLAPNRDRFGIIDPELGAAELDAPRRYLVSALVSADPLRLESAAQFLGGLAAGVACSLPAPEPRRLA